jgi:putative SOS response-associated peptidase YedK
MCGRYTQTQPLAELVKRFATRQAPFNCKPSYNIAPGTRQPVISHEGARLMTWGYVPAWTQAPPPGLFPPGAADPAPEIREGLINARAEGITARPSFRSALYKTRCLVPADGYYEWQQSAGARQPWRFELRDKSLFALAGLYDEKTATFAIITCAAGALGRQVHNRMPVILEPRHEPLWLDPRMRDSETLLPLLRAYDSAKLHAYRVSDLVNDPGNDSPACLAPLPA